MVRILLALFIGYLVVTQTLNAGMYTEMAASLIIALLALPTFQRLLD